MKKSKSKPDAGSKDRMEANARAFRNVLTAHFDGSRAKMAEALTKAGKSCTRQYVSTWEEVPLPYVRTLAKITGVGMRDIHPYPYP